MRTPLRLNCTTPAGKFDQLARAGSSSASRAAVCCSAVSVPRKACAAATEVVVSAAAPVAGVEAGAGAGADSPGGEASSAQAVETIVAKATVVAVSSIRRNVRRRPGPRPMAYSARLNWRCLAIS